MRLAKREAPKKDQRCEASIVESDGPHWPVGRRNTSGADPSLRRQA
jgi:hypothetical protein